MEIKTTTIHWGVFLLLATISFATADEEKKKLKLVLDKLDKVKDAEHILKTDITFDKVDDSEIKINGEIKQSVDLDDDYKVSRKKNLKKSFKKEILLICALGNHGYSSFGRRGWRIQKGYWFCQSGSLFPHGQSI